MKTKDNKNSLYFGDNLDILKDLCKQNPNGFIDLIYIDPPFNSKRNYNLLFESIELDNIKAQKEAFVDTWSNVSYIDTLNEIADLNQNLFNLLKTLDRISTSKSGVSYLTTMAIRIWYMHKLLKDTGSFYLHCDPTMSHYLKIICDMIFGGNNFKNEIIWSYKRYTAASNRFQRLHDVILFYSKTTNCNYNDIRESYGSKSGKADSHYKQDENGKWFRWQKRKGKDPYKVYLSEGRRLGDVWEISTINASAKERLGYPTQKPETLLERIIKASSNKGDLVADFFCGCGTTIAVAENLNRKWIGADISHLAVKLMASRLIGKNKDSKKIRDTFELFGFPRDIESAKMLATETKGGRLKFEEWIVEVMLHGVLNEDRTQMGFDGYFTFDIQGEKQIGLIEVKSGGATPTMLNHFIQTLNSKNGKIGIFVCFEKQATKNMKVIAKQEGYYNEELFGHHYPKIQIMTVEKLLDGDDINIPVSTKTTFKVAPKTIQKQNQKKIDFEN